MEQVVKYCVYRILSRTTGKAYIGITKDTKLRWAEHVKSHKSFNSTRSKSKLSNAMRKYSVGDFIFEILLYGEKDYCGLMERKFIEELDTFRNGYNQSPGGEGTVYYQIWKTEFGGQYTPGVESQRKLFPEDKERLISEAKSGISLSEMSWLPIKEQYAYQVLKAEGVIAFNGRWIKDEDKERLISETLAGIPVTKMNWWLEAHDKSYAYDILRAAGIKYVNAKNILSDEILKELEDKYYSLKIPSSVLKEEYNLSIHQFYNALKRIKRRQ